MIKIPETSILADTITIDGYKFFYNFNGSMRCATCLLYSSIQADKNIEMGKVTQLFIEKACNCPRQDDSNKRVENKMFEVAQGVVSKFIPPNGLIKTIITKSGNKDAVLTRDDIAKLFVEKMKKCMNKTHIEIVKLVLGSELPTSTKNEVARHYLLPRPGYVLAPVEIEEEADELGIVDRPTAEEIEIEENPRLKAEYRETEKLMGKK